MGVYIGVDFHARKQTVSYLTTEDGEIRRVELDHEKDAENAARLPMSLTESPRLNELREAGWYSLGSANLLLGAQAPSLAIHASELMRGVARLPSDEIE